mmetsp:Transcript_27365/g.29537  ORF Transcript_27365/g.29537 Transcript_27365/m.29537 type:complete len:299 (-) Transcript_27365:287-1183(-)
MLLSIAKLTSGLAAVATAVTSKCISSNNVPACFHYVAIKNTVPSALVGLSSLIAVPTTVKSTNSISNVLELIRGGGGVAAAAATTTAIVDFQRESLTLQGMATYGTITALIMNASLRLFTSVKFKKEQSRIVCNIFNIATALCIISGAFTAILFQLLTIYSKSALGHSNDVGYLTFKAATRHFRHWGFRCFLTEMISFVVSFMASLYNLLWDNARRLERAQLATATASGSGKSGSDAASDIVVGSKSALTRTGKMIFGGSVFLMLLGAYQIRLVLLLAAEHVYDKKLGVLNYKMPTSS